MAKYEYDDPIEKFEELRNLAEQQKSKRERIKGALQQVSRTLKQRGFRNIRAVKSFRSKKIDEKKRKEAIFRQKLQELTDRYDKYL